MSDLDQVTSLEPDNSRYFRDRHSSTLASLKDLAAKKAAEAEAERHLAAEAERISSQRPVVNSIGMEFKLLPGGTFTMSDHDVGSLMSFVVE
jgi:hypothetical protein